MSAASDIPCAERMRLTLQRQRDAFLADGPPGLKERKQRLRRLRTAVLAQRPALEAAISADFGKIGRAHV